MPTVDQCLEYLYESMKTLVAQEAFIAPEKSDIPEDLNAYPAVTFSQCHSSLESFKFGFRLVWPLAEKRINDEAMVDKFLDQHVKPDFREEVIKDIKIIKSVIKVLKQSPCPTLTKS